MSDLNSISLGPKGRRNFATSGALRSPRECQRRKRDRWSPHRRGQRPAHSESRTVGRTVNQVNITRTGEFLRRLAFAILPRRQEPPQRLGHFVVASRPVPKCRLQLRSHFTKSLPSGHCSSPSVVHSSFTKRTATSGGRPAVTAPRSAWRSAGRDRVLARRRSRRAITPALPRRRVPRVQKRPPVARVMTWTAPPAPAGQRPRSGVSHARR